MAHLDESPLQEMSDVTTMTQEETEEELVRIAQTALSECRWTVGECASKWTKRYSKGRTDADFGNLVGLSGDQIFQRRRVWDSFSDVRSQFPSLKWSHFYLALNWDDAADCLQWAEETQSTVAQMRAWRRAQRGEDLTTTPDEFEPPFTQNVGEMAFVQDPDSFQNNLQPSGFGGEAGNRRPQAGVSANGGAVDSNLVTALARELDPNGDHYAPFHSGAIHPPTESAEPKPATGEILTPEMLAKRLCTTLERCCKALNDDVLQQFERLSPKLRERLSSAVEELHNKLSAVKA